jgi:hypothetical protein
LRSDHHSMMTIVLVQVKWWSIELIVKGRARKGWSRASMATMHMIGSGRL